VNIKIKLPQRISYYLRRIQEAPIDVIVRKLSELLYKKAFWVFYGVNRYFTFAYPSKLTDPSISSLNLVGEDIRNGLISASVHSDWRLDTFSRARDFLLSRKFQILGYGEVEVQGGLSWHRDSIHDFTWVAKYFDNIDFVTIDHRSDVKVPWELSRLQYLLWLAEGYVLDSENQPRYVKLFECIVEDWLIFNPPGYGVNWIVSMEVAIRGCNLALASSVFFNVLDTGLKSKIIKSLHEHLNFIRRFPEFSDVSGNHYLSNLMGVSVLYSCLYGDSAIQTINARKLFYKEADDQFESDGCHLERAPVYHRLCLDMVAIVLAFEGRSGECTKTGLNVFMRGLKFCRAFSSSKGLLPIIGDCDSGHVLYFNQNARKFRELESFAQGFNEEHLSVEYLDSNVIWHLAISQNQDMLKVPVSRSYHTTDKVYDLSGFIAGHDSQLDCIMRVGAQGLMGRASHDHDDSLSIWVYLNGLDFIVEKGCHSYTLDKVTRGNYIGSLAHNLVQPAGSNRSKAGTGSILQTAVGAATAKTWSSIKENGGYRLRAELDITKSNSKIFSYCSRELISYQNRFPALMVIDKWGWSYGKQKSELRWHFTPAVIIKICSDNLGVVNLMNAQGEVFCKLNFDCLSPIELEVFPFEFSEKYGETRIGNCLRIIVEDHAECQIASNFVFLDSESLS
jgi:hypothetical protein